MTTGRPAAAHGSGPSVAARFGRAGRPTRAQRTEPSARPVSFDEPTQRRPAGQWRPIQRSRPRARTRALDGPMLSKADASAWETPPGRRAPKTGATKRARRHGGAGTRGCAQCDMPRPRHVHDVAHRPSAPRTLAAPQRPQYRRRPAPRPGTHLGPLGSASATARPPQYPRPPPAASSRYPRGRPGDRAIPRGPSTHLRPRGSRTPGSAPAAGIDGPAPGHGRDAGHAGSQQLARAASIEPTAAPIATVAGPVPARPVACRSPVASRARRERRPRDPKDRCTGSQPGASRKGYDTTTLPPPRGLGNFHRRTALAIQLATARSLIVDSCTTATGTLPVGPIVN